MLNWMREISGGAQGVNVRVAGCSVLRRAPKWPCRNPAGRIRWRNEWWAIFPPASLCGGALRCFMLVVPREGFFWSHERCLTVWREDIRRRNTLLVNDGWPGFLSVFGGVVFYNLACLMSRPCGSHDCSTGRLWAVSASQPHDGWQRWDSSTRKHLIDL